MRQNQSGYRTIGDLAQTNRIMNHTFWVGVYPGMTEEIVHFIVDAIREFCQR